MDNGITWSPVAPLNSNAVSDEWGDDRLHFTTDGRTWIAVWDSQSDLGGTIGHDYDILFAYSTDNGASWSPPAPLNTNAGTDSIEDWDMGPHIATDGLGRWIAVWSSENDLGGTIGSDYDILYSTAITTPPRRSPVASRLWSFYR